MDRRDRATWQRSRFTRGEERLFNEMQVSKYRSAGPLLRLGGFGEAGAELALQSGWRGESPQRRQSAQCRRGGVCKCPGPLGASGRMGRREVGRQRRGGVGCPPGPCAQRAVLGGGFQHRGQRLALTPAQGGTEAQGGWPAAPRRGEGFSGLSFKSEETGSPGSRAAAWTEGGTAPSCIKGDCWACSVDEETKTRPELK